MDSMGMSSAFFKARERWQQSQAYLWGQLMGEVALGRPMDKIVSDLRSHGMGERDIMNCLNAATREQRRELMNSFAEHRATS